MGTPFHFARPRKQLPLAVLTPRQIEYIEALIAGKSVPQIAKAQGCYRENVTQVLIAARKRTGTKTREQLAVWWAMRKLSTRALPPVAAQQEEIAA
jgi:DNA-binding CsgD family transcriptional regulator